MEDTMNISPAPAGTPVAIHLNITPPVTKPAKN